MLPKNGVGWHHLYIDRHICRYIDRYKIYSIYQISCSRPPICIQLIREMHRVIPLNCIQYHATTICNLGKKNEIQFKLNCLCCILLVLVLTFLKITCSFLSWSNATLNSNQMRPYFSAKTIWEFSYTGFKGIQTLGQFEKTGS